MQFRLRTLLIVLVLGPMVLAGAWITVHYALQPRFQIDARTGSPSPARVREIMEYQFRRAKAREQQRTNERATDQP